MNSATSLSIFALLALSSLSAADTITGHVVSSTGVPVSGVNIDAIRVSNGNDQDVANDGTNANGDFLSTIQAGVYDLIFFPPAPPATSHLALVVRNVVVSGTKSLGTLTLPAGFVLSGHVQNQSGAPISQVTLQVTDQVTGNDVPLALHKTNAFGNFSIAVPRNAIELRLDASGLLPVVASQRLTLTPVANTNMGNLTLAPGFLVTGHVQRSANGTAAASVDLDFGDRATGETLFTPNDNSNGLGNFSVVVPAGRYDIDFCAPFADHLVGARIPKRLISADQDLGIIAMDPGFVLTGTIRSFDATPLANADVDVHIQSTGVKVNTCDDNSNASGVYSIIVPAGNLKVSFRPPTFDMAMSSDIHPNILVSANTTLNGTLPFCVPPSNYGSGLAGTGGFVPHISSSGGVPANGNSAFSIELSGGRGGATAALILSLEQRSIPSLGGTLLVGPSRTHAIRVFTTLGGTPGAGGVGSQRMAMPFSIGLASGLTLYAQFAVQDPLAPQGWALSEGLQFLVCQ